jgi:hypothetical protein
MAENYKLLYEQMKKIVTTYQDEVVPCLREIIKDREQNQIKVRCKDCVYRHDSCFAGNGNTYCDFHHKNFPLDGFCSYGERRTEDDHNRTE